MNIEAGLNVPGLFSADFKIVSKIIQNSNQRLLLLDILQYDICMSIKNLTDDKSRQDYLRKMIDYKLQAQRIYLALMAFSFSPQDSDMQLTIKDLISSIVYSEQRTRETK